MGKQRTHRQYVSSFGMKLDRNCLRCACQDVRSRNDRKWAVVRRHRIEVYSQREHALQERLWSFDVGDASLDRRLAKAARWLVVALDRDRSVFAIPQDVDFAREDNPHLAFSAGVHRCVGSHLARRELRVAIEQWLRRVPDFHLPAGTQIRYSPYAHLTIEHLPLEWSARR